MIRKRRSARARAAAIQVPSHEADFVRLWILRALFLLGCSSSFIRNCSFDNDAMAAFLGMEPLVEDYDEKKAMAFLRKAHKEAEAMAENGMAYSDALGNNLQRLQELVGLSDIECDLLAFMVLMHNDYNLSYMCSRCLDDISTQSAFTVLATLLDYSRDDIANAFSGKSKLSRCGLVTIDAGSTMSLRQRFDLLSGGFSDRLLSPESRAEDFLLDMVKPGKNATLAVEDYQHIEQEYRLVDHYLRTALEQKKAGVNILVYGDPGTGKSEMVRLLAQKMGVGLLEMASENEQGDSIMGKTRLRAYKAAQQFFASQKTVILFDEIQDVFDDGGFFGRSTAQLRKAEINTLLEENPLPTFWLSNSISSMDNAFIRRFDIVVALEVPPMSRRREILQHAMEDLAVPPAILQRFARHESLSPAIVTRTASVVRSVRSELGNEQVPQMLETLFNNTLEAQGFAPIAKTAANALPAFYDPRFVNADVDLAVLAEGVRANPSARICLYGPPGTGKSAFAQWLAECLQRPLHNKKLSDILSMYVGGTEKNLGKAFHQAELDKAVLLLDEVDSYLQDRRQAQRNWEVTGVNEMLVQMEAFNGVFIASTNLMHNLDQAALRRFDIKIKLGYLKPEQASELFAVQCEALAIPEPSEALLAQVAAMPLLTPGDFAAVQRQHRFRPLKNADCVLAALREECMVKEGGNTQRIGFV